MPQEPNIPDGWSEAERWAWGEIRAGRIADFHNRSGQELDPKAPDGWENAQQDRLLSSAFLITIITEVRFRIITPFSGVRINQASIKEEIDLQHARLERQLWLENCRLNGTVNLFGLQINGWLSLEGSWIGGAVNLNGAELESHVSFEQVEIVSEVDLRGAKIGGSLNMDCSHFAGKLNLSGVEVGQYIHMSEQATFQEVNLAGAKIGRQLIMAGSHFSGKLNLSGVEVGGTLDMVDSHFAGKLTMDGVEVGQSLFMRSSSFPENEEVGLQFARIGSSLDLSGATLGALDLTATTIMGELNLGSAKGYLPPSWVGDSRMILRNVTVGAIQDREHSWPEQLELGGLQYSRLGGYGAEGSADILNRPGQWFIRWLARDTSFSPQPYTQLASVLHEAGYPSKANDIRYAARERARQEAGKRHVGKPREPLRWFGLSLLQLTIGYGLGSRYFRVLWWFMGFALIGFLVLLVSLGRSEVDLPTMALTSLDQVLPIVTLNEAHEDLIMMNCPRWAIWYFYFQKVVGYILGGFLGAGLAGLTQKS